jgi:hypothetical protein
MCGRTLTTPIDQVLCTPDPPPVRRAASILVACQNKIKSWDQLLALHPLYHLPQIVHLLGTAAVHLASNSPSALSGPDVPSEDPVSY